MEAEHDEVLLNGRFTAGCILSAAKDSTMSIRGGIVVVLFVNVNVVANLENKKSRGQLPSETR